LLPQKACEAVAAAIWRRARLQAAALAGAEPQKRRRLEGPEEAAAGAAAPAAFAAPGAVAAGGPQAGLGARSQSPSQTQATQEEELPAEAWLEARAALGSALEGLGPQEAQELLAATRRMALAAGAYWREVSLDLGRAAASLARFLQQQRRLYWRKATWRGVNLGGWLVLEPGPSARLFQRFGPAQCEWQLLRQMRRRLGPEAAAEALQEHREAFLQEHDLQLIAKRGFNAVRLPLGYWAVSGPAPGEPFLGPCLELVDRCLGWCQRHGLQAVLDLHGAPGGESGERPCGRERRDWTWRDWRLGESLQALELLARRYAGHPSVSGISVCNEPSEQVPAEVLCDFYDRAVEVIRGAGMPPEEVAVLLPVYRTERLDEIWRLWNRSLDGFARHANVAFDLHLYHCFGAWWHRQGLGGHLRMARRHRKVLRRVPAVVGEWSLALPPAACGDEPREEEAALRAFAEAQLEAYSQASHGWFFWNWRDGPQHPGWDAGRCLERGWLQLGPKGA